MTGRAQGRVRLPSVMRLRRRRGERTLRLSATAAAETNENRAPTGTEKNTKRDAMRGTSPALAETRDEKRDKEKEKRPAAAPLNQTRRGCPLSCL